MRHLLGSGVHPYDSTLGNKNIVGLLVVFKNIKGLKLVIDSGKLADCLFKVRKLKVLAKDTRNSTVIEMIEKIKE